MAAFLPIAESPSRRVAESPTKKCQGARGQSTDSRHRSCPVIRGTGELECHGTDEHLHTEAHHHADDADRHRQGKPYEGTDHESGPADEAPQGSLQKLHSPVGVNARRRPDSARSLIDDGAGQATSSAAACEIGQGACPSLSGKGLPGGRGFTTIGARVPGMVELDPARVGRRR
jgi:hypothetical protein